MTPRLSVDQPLRTERLTLRVIDESDTDAVHGWRSSAAVTEYLPYGPQTRDQVLGSLRAQGRLRTLTRDGDRAVLAARVDDRTIGELHLVLRSATHRGYEIGWVFSPEFSGRGFATEAARAGLDRIFEAGGAHRVIAELDPRNESSARLCRRLGMREEARFVADTRLDDGTWADTAIWAVLEDEHGRADEHRRRE